MIRFHDEGDETTKVTGKVVAVHATKKHRRVGIAPPIPNFDNKWKWVVSFMSRSRYLREQTPVPIKYEAG
jgi:hypothetical protein